MFSNVGSRYLVPKGPGKDQVTESGRTPPSNRKTRTMLGVMLLVTQDALVRTLIELTHLKGENRLDWLSKFEAQLIRDAKGIVAEGIAMEDKIAQIDNAIK